MQLNECVHWTKTFLWVFLDEAGKPSKLIANVHKKNLAIALMKPPLQKLKTLNDLSVTKDHCKNLHAQNLKKNITYFL